MRRLGVLGWPIAHSRSPAMHNAAIDALGLEYSYEAIPVEPARLADWIGRAERSGFAGVNVTIPHKEAALALCEADELAGEVGAVNTLSFADGHVYGTNTDVFGFDRMRDGLGVDPRAFTVILGAGGAARAVVAAMREHGAEIVVVARRDVAMLVGGESIEVEPWEPKTFAALFPRCELLVDATPRGLSDLEETLPLHLLPKTATVIDLVVRKETPLVRAARARSLRAEPGTAMLLYQGVRAFEIWTGHEAPIEIMQRALVSVL